MPPCDRPADAKSALPCRHCEAVIATATPKAIYPAGSLVAVSSMRDNRPLRLRCPGCKRVTVWQPSRIPPAGP